MIKFDINKNSFSSEYLIVDENFYFNINRRIRITEKYIDCFGSCWAIFKCKSNQTLNVKFRNGTEYISLPENSIIFCPPFSLLESVMEVGQLYEFETITSSWPLDFSFQSPMFLVFDTISDDLFTSRETILKLVAKFKFGSPLKPEKTSSQIALRFKNEIDKNFTNHINITHIASKLQYSRASAVRAFTMCFGIKPNEYLNRIKIFEALYYMSCGLNIGESSRAVGYLDQTRFMLNFKKVFGFTPKEFNFLQDIRKF